MNITLRQLRVFIEVARLKSFSRAGDEIGLTQSAVSRSVRELEGEIGLKLIDRTTRDVQLTDVGTNLIASVSRLLGDLDDALREIREIGEQRRGRVIVAASPTIACRLLPRVVGGGGGGVGGARGGSISNRFGRMRQMVAETATALFFRIISNRRTFNSMRIDRELIQVKDG